MSKLPLMTTEPRFSLCFPWPCLRADEPPAPCPLWSPRPKERGFPRYLFHPGSYVLPQSQLPALQFRQPQALPNLLVWEAELLGPPQGLFWNGFTGVKQRKTHEALQQRLEDTRVLVSPVLHWGAVAIGACTWRQEKKANPAKPCTPHTQKIFSWAGCPMHVPSR